MFPDLQAHRWRENLRLSAAGVLVVWVLAILAISVAWAQRDDDQGWAQFSRENTLRATVISASPAGKNDGSFAVKTESGQDWRVLYGVNTRLMKDRGPVRPNEIQAGDMIFAAGNVDAKKKTVGAAILIDIPAEEVRKAREGLGKTWSAGRIVSIAGTTIQVHRLDGVEQKIAVDENTSFREKRDSVTLADIRPGQGFRAEGHVMNGTFTATTFTVFDLKGHEPWLDAGSEAR
ncbi:MAG: DUF5666 domain-containing protein [Acidobacteriaceae bacterium]